jgi:hypothetical protein
MQKFGEVIAEIKFPSSLWKGDKITGTITLKNPFNEDNVYLLCEVITWDENYYAVYTIVKAGQSYTFNFPADFKARIPENAQDPAMPSHDATININAYAVSSTDRIDETATITIKLSALQMKALGIPIWGWIALSAAIAVAGTSLYIIKKKKFKI